MTLFLFFAKLLGLLYTRTHWQCLMMAPLKQGTYRVHVARSRVPRMNDLVPDDNCSVLRACSQL